MLFNIQETQLIASCGWVERSSILAINPQTLRTEKYDVGDAAFIILKKALNNLFVCAHHYQGEKLAFSIHSFAEPRAKLAEIILTPQGFTFQGNSNLWQFGPEYFVGLMEDG